MHFKFLNQCNTDSDGIHCPYCKEPNLHQVGVEAVFREKEDGRGVVSIHTQTRSMDFIEEDYKLMGRRDSMFTVFTCEHCDKKPVLCIYQHKGVTFIGWVDSPEVYVDEIMKNVRVVNEAR